MNDEPTLFEGREVEKDDASGCWISSPKPKCTRKPRAPKAQPVPQPEPIPKRLYVSDGRMFGLFEGGQLDQGTYHPPISWERLKPIQRVDASKEARTK